jgi:hypothetical protein
MAPKKPTDTSSDAKALDNPESTDDPTKGTPSTSEQPKKAPDTYKKTQVETILQQASEDNHKNIIIPKDTILSDEIVGKILKQFADAFGLSYITATVAVLLLFLKGAANKGTPDSLSAEVRDGDGKIVSCDKYTLMFAYRTNTKNVFLRRLAETIANSISTFAQKNNLEGDLSKQINNKLKAKNETILTPKERAWCSSFNQNNPTMEGDPDLKRVASLLSLDLEEKFRKSNPSKKSSTKPSPKKQGNVKKGGKKSDKNLPQTKASKKKKK